jgi:hypothetical protein
LNEGKVKKITPSAESAFSTLNDRKPEAVPLVNEENVKVVFEGLLTRFSFFPAINYLAYGINLSLHVIKNY